MQLHMFISGRVQGVFFRDQTKAKALKLGLKGFVKNLEDSRVEIVAQGSPEDIMQLMVFCKKEVENSEVKDIEVNEEKEESFETFSLKY